RTDLSNAHPVHRWSRRGCFPKGLPTPARKRHSFPNHSSRAGRLPPPRGGSALGDSAGRIDVASRDVSSRLLVLLVRSGTSVLERHFVLPAYYRNLRRIIGRTRLQYLTQNTRVRERPNPRVRLLPRVGLSS